MTELKDLTPGTLDKGVTSDTPVEVVSVKWFGDSAIELTYSDRDGDWEIYIMGIDGSNPTNLTNNSWADTNPDWSPDGSQIAFETTRNGPTDIYVMNSNGSNPTNLSNNSFYDADPVWSPDGSQIAFTSHRPEVGSIRKIFVMGADGTNQTQITEGVLEYEDLEYEDVDW
jgi:Tol biopolymer transport system component